MRKCFASRSYPRSASTSRMMRRPGCRSTWTTKSTASPISASVSEKVVCAWLRMTRLAKRWRAFSAHFAQNDPVRSPAESRLQEIVERDICLERIGLAFDRKNVWFLDVQLGSIFDDDDALLFRDRICQYSQERGLSRACSATDEQRFPTANLFLQKVGDRSRERAASDQVIDRVMAAGEFPYGERGSRAHDRRNDRRQAASVRKLRVQNRVVFVKPFAELVGNDFEAGAQSAGVERDGCFPLHDSITFVP